MASADIRLLIVDWRRLCVEAISQVLQEHPTITVVGVAADGPSAILAAEELRPDVVVVGVSARGVDASIFAKCIRECSSARLLLIRSNEAHIAVVSQMSLGALGCVDKRCGVDEFVQAIIAVAQGVRFVDEETRTKIFLGISLNARKDPVALTGREIEVVTLLCAGMSTKDVASYLGLSTKTVESHRRAIFEAWNVTCIPQLVRTALRLGLIEL